jgi:hypothetical protein
LKRERKSLELKYFDIYREKQEKKRNAERKKRRKIRIRMRTRSIN